MVESVKAASELFSPVSGKIGEVNNMVINNPSIINSSPEDEGWFIKMEITNKSELEDLMDETSYMKFLKESE